MQNKKGNTNMIVSVIVVIFIVGLVVYALVNKKDTTSPAVATVTTTTPAQSQLTTTTETTTTQVTQEKGSTTLSSSQPKKSMEPNIKKLANFTPVASITTLQKIDIAVGTGQEVKAGDTVSVHYTGAVAATGVVFQSSKDFGPTPVTFPLSGVIKGWTDGIPGMKVGGTRRLLIPAAQAYGATPPPGSGIPAYADLVFDVELMGVK